MDTIPYTGEMPEDGDFRYLTHAEFEALSQAQKISYLTHAISSLTRATARATDASGAASSAPSLLASPNPA